MRKFCIFTTRRSGSSWLCTLLASHPQIKEYGEVFIPDRQPKLTDRNATSFFEFKQNQSYKNRFQLICEYLEFIYQCSDGYDAVGFKLMYRQLRLQPELLSKLFLDRYRIIHLVRENYFDALLSYKIAKSSGVFHSTGKVHVPTVILNPKSVIKTLQKEDLKIRLIENILKIAPNPVLRVSYEQLVQDTDATLNSIVKFLSIPERSENFVFQSRLKKTNKRAYHEAIANFGEVQAALQNTKFAHFLE